MPKPTATQVNIDSTLDEQRSFDPPAEFSQKAQIKSLAEYEALYRESVEQPEKFWARAAEELHWFKKWDKVLEWKAPWAEWFVGGEINLSYNCLDRHVQTVALNAFSAASSGVRQAIRIKASLQIAERLDVPLVLGGAAVYRCDKRPVFSTGFSR